jgi:hypothetical protein
MVKKQTRNWRDVKAEAHRRGLTSPANVEENKQRLLDGVRADRLAEIRKQQGLTQQDAADDLAVERSTMEEVSARVAKRRGGQVGLKQAVSDLAAERDRP